MTNTRITEKGLFLIRLEDRSVYYTVRSLNKESRFSYDTVINYMFNDVSINKIWNTPQLTTSTESIENIVGFCSSSKTSLSTKQIRTIEFIGSIKEEIKNENQKESL